MSRRHIRRPLQPNELVSLQRAFDAVCTTHQLEKSSLDAEALAVILFNAAQKKSCFDAAELTSFAETIWRDAMGASAMSGSATPGT